MCPGQYESAGKSKHGTARHGASWRQRQLAVAAMSASRTKGTELRRDLDAVGTDFSCAIERPAGAEKGSGASARCDLRRPR
ncbi:MAG: hypothetical protein JWP02_2196 [Acidimicrobiales bacterium]|nr:hypothetical protein [Acidimicrobiales bacterium]